MIRCGFFDSVEKDRLYTASDMVKPYELLVSNGVFATPSGTPSDMLQVIAKSGLTLSVKEGRGIFKDKWLINDGLFDVTLDVGDLTLPRIDTVVIRIDTSESVRNGTIAVKKGTPSANPVAPTMVRSATIHEYRLADILVGSKATSVTQANITDRRGSADCPWITSLIKQVDTSTLMEQWVTAYQLFYDQSNSTFDEWFAELQETIGAQTLIRCFTAHYVTTTENQTTIPIGISEYTNRELDILHVYINGMLLIDGVDYTLPSEGVPTAITLTAPLSKDQSVIFVLFKTISVGEAETVFATIDAIKPTANNGEHKHKFTSGNALDNLKSVPQGFYTVSLTKACTNLPSEGVDFNGHGHKFSDKDGWVVLISTAGDSWVNTMNNNVWGVWKKQTM